MSNRRIVLVDQNETPDYIRYFSCCTNKEIYTLQLLERIDPEKKKLILTLGEGDAAMLVGAEPFKYLRQYYHYGVRSENYFDCSKLFRLSIEGGAFVKVVVEYPSAQEINAFLSPDFTFKVTFPGFKQAVLRTYDEAVRFLGYLEAFPMEQNFGYDYEGSGMPLDKWYELSGVSISTESFAGFISFTDVRHEIGGNSQEYKGLLRRLGQWLVTRMDHVWTYNMQYEFQVSHRMLGVDAYNLCDTSIVNTLDGHHLKNFSLKWTAQRILGVNTWDVEFDKISDLIDSMLFVVEGELKKDKHKVLKITKDNFEQTEEWKILCQKYPNYIDEFKSLILEYWGNPFMCIPSKILGYYCNLDAFYTLMIYLRKKDEYTKECWDVNLDNIRLGCRLMSSGLYIDEPYRKKYDYYCKQMMAWGITYCAQVRCFYKMNAHKEKMADIKKYNDVAIKLLETGKFYNGNAVDIVKNLLLENLDNNETTETGLDEGGIAMKFGNSFADNFIDIVKNAMVEVKMKTKIDLSIGRKKKILGIIAEKAAPLFGLDKIKIGPKHLELEKYLYYEKAYKELQKVSKNQLKEVNNVPDKLYAFGRYWNLLDYSDYISDNYFKCKSPLENDEIIYDLTMLFRSESCFITALTESMQQLPETSKFYITRGITDINQGFNDFIVEGTKWIGDKNNYNGPYPKKVFEKFEDHFKSPTKSKVVKKNETSYVYSCSDKLKETWTDFTGFNTQAALFPDYMEQYVDYGKQFDPNDLTDTFYFMRKMTVNYLLYKKYAKLLSTYVGDDGMFKKNNRYVIEGEDHIPLRYADPNEPGAVEKCFVKYEVQKKSSKRWSSAFHTIISHGDCKDCLCPPPAYDENGNIIYGGSNMVLTYFDISSAEVKSAGYASLDPGLISKFEAGEDIYIYSAKLYLGDKFDKLSKKEQKKWRKRFKYEPSIMATY
jgi:hypothetical protein